MTAERLLLAGGALAFLATLVALKCGRLLPRYALAWLVISALLLLTGLFPRGTTLPAGAAGLAQPLSMVPAPLILALALVVVLLCAWGLSISIALSNHRRMLIRLCQDLALLRAEVQRRLEVVPPETGSLAAGQPAAAAIGTAAEPTAADDAGRGNQTNDQITRGATP